MNILLDTHVLLWWLDDHPTLSTVAKSAISTGKNNIFYSAVSIWEIRIKEALGKLKLPPDFDKVLKEQRMIPLNITVKHAHSIKSLPLIHRDPFDRLLIAQAKLEKMTLMTRDAAIKKYDVKTIGA
jgi:PIN domain nuclease of toxin-antitoxin system